MLAATSIPRTFNRAAELAIRAVRDFPFTEPGGESMGPGSRYARLTRNQVRLLTFLNLQPRESGVTTLSVHHACKVLELRAVDIDRLLDELNVGKWVFFASFNVVASGRVRAFYAVKPYRQHGDTPLDVARRLADKMISEGLA